MKLTIKFFLIPDFIDTCYNVRIKWITKIRKQLFKVKSKFLYQSNVICNCLYIYLLGLVHWPIGIQYDIRWEEHQDANK